MKRHHSPFPFIFLKFLFTGFWVLLYPFGTVDGEDLPSESNLHHLAVHKAREKQYQESEALFRQAIAADSKNPVLLCDFAKLFADQNRLSDSEIILKNALLLEPSHRRVLYNLGRTIALQPNRQTEGLRYLKLALGEGDAYRELAKICRTQGHKEQAEFAEQQAKLAPQNTVAPDAVLSAAVTMDEKTKKELTDQIRLELLRLETKEIAVQQEKAEQQNLQNLTAEQKNPERVQPSPSFQSAANASLHLLPKTEENSSVPKTAVKTISPELSESPSVKTLPKPAAETELLTDIRKMPSSEPPQVSNLPVPPKQEISSSEPPVPIATLSNIAATKNTPEYTAIRKEPVRQLDLSPPEKRTADFAAITRPDSGKTVARTEPAKEKTQPVQTPQTHRPENKNSSARQSPQQPSGPLSSASVQESQSAAAPPEGYHPNAEDNMPSPIHITPNIITKERQQNSAAQLVKINAGQGVVKSAPVLNDPFRAALETANTENKAVPSSAIPEKAAAFEKISDYQFTSAQAPNVLKFGIISEEEKKTEIHQSVPKKPEQTTAAAFQPPTILKFGPTDGTAQYAQKANPVKQVPKLLPVPAEKSEETGKTAANQAANQRFRIPETKISEPAVMAEIATPVAVANGKTVQEPEEELFVQKILPKFVEPSVVAEPVQEPAARTQPVERAVAAVEEPKPVFGEPRLMKIESVPQQVVKRTLPNVPPETTETKDSLAYLEEPKKNVSVRASTKDTQTEFFGKIAGKKPVESRVFTEVKPETLALLEEQGNDEEQEDDTVGFATTRKSRAGNGISAVSDILNPQSEWNDNPIFAEITAPANEAGFARSSQFSQKKK